MGYIKNSAFTFAAVRIDSDPWKVFAFDGTKYFNVSTNDNIGTLLTLMNEKNPDYELATKLIDEDRNVNVMPGNSASILLESKEEILEYLAMTNY